MLTKSEECYDPLFTTLLITADIVRHFVCAVMTLAINSIRGEDLLTSSQDLHLEVFEWDGW